MWQVLGACQWPSIKSAFEKIKHTYTYMYLYITCPGVGIEKDLFSFTLAPTPPDKALRYKLQMYQRPQGRQRTTPAPLPSFHQEREKHY